MLDKLRVFNFFNKLDIIIKEPTFKSKLHDLIPNIKDFNVKVNLKPATLHITRKNDISIDNLIIKIYDNAVEYYYYSTGNFNECGKICNSKDNIITRYCTYDIICNNNRQDVKTKTILSIYDHNLVEIYKYVEDNIENYITIDGKKEYLQSDDKDSNVLKTKKQMRMKNNDIITITQSKYHNENMQQNNSIKYCIDRGINNSSKISYNQNNKSLTKKHV